MTIFDSTTVGAELRKRGVGARDRERCVAWWMVAKAGQTMLLVRYDGPTLRITAGSDEVVEVAPGDDWKMRSKAVSSSS